MIIKTQLIYTYKQEIHDIYSRLQDMRSVSFSISRYFILFFHLLNGKLINILIRYKICVAIHQFDEYNHEYND